MGVAMDDASLAAPAVLCVFGELWVGADLSAGVEAVFLVQHAVWNGTVASVRLLLWIRGRRGSRVDREAQAEVPPRCCRRAADPAGWECGRDAAREAADLCR